MGKRELFSSFFILVFLMSVVPAGWFSDDITFSTDQKDYYFIIGQDAGIFFNMSNDLGRNVSGMITYNLVGPGVQNSQSTTFTVAGGDSASGVGFGRSEGPSDLTFSLKFVYGDKEIILENIGIHFVQKPEEQKNEQNKQKSSEEQSQPSQQSQQNSPQQSMQQKVSTNQAAQNGQEMKQNIERDSKRAEQAKMEFMEELQKNEELAKAHEEMIRDGFEQSGGEINPDMRDSSSGDFEFNYKDADGNEGTLSGRIENGTLTELEETNGVELKRLKSLISEDLRFKKLNEKLMKEGYSEKNIDYNKEENVTEVRFDYSDEFGNEESIVAVVENENVRDVYWDKERNWAWLWGFLMVPIALVSVYFFRRRKKMVTLDSPIVRVKNFDYLKEARKLLKKAEKEFEKKNYKDAYGLANKSIRMFLCMSNGISQEMTNYEILRDIEGIPKDTKEIFDLCCLVGFAKYKPNKKDFSEIVSFGRRLVS